MAPKISENTKNEKYQKYTSHKQDTTTNGTEDSERKLSNYSHLIFDKGVNNIHYRNSLFNKWC
jgi:hypothetical protein